MTGEKHEVVQHVKQKKEGGDWRFLALAGTALVASFLLSFFVVQVIRVDGPSMEPTLPEGSWVLVSRTAYQGPAPQVGDIIVFRNSSVYDGLMIKRVMGVGGDHVCIREGTFYRNGEALPHTEPTADNSAADNSAANNSATDNIATDNSAAGDTAADSALKYSLEDYPEVVIPEGSVFVMGDNAAHSEDSRSWKQPFIPYKDITGKMIFRLY